MAVQNVAVKRFFFIRSPWKLFLARKEWSFHIIKMTKKKKRKKKKKDHFYSKSCSSEMSEFLSKLLFFLGKYRTSRVLLKATADRFNTIHEETVLFHLPLFLWQQRQRYLGCDGIFIPRKKERKFEFTKKKKEKKYSSKEQIAFRFASERNNLLLSSLKMKFKLVREFNVIPFRSWIHQNILLEKENAHPRNL